MGFSGHGSISLSSGHIFGWKGAHQAINSSLVVTSLITINLIKCFGLKQVTLSAQKKKNGNPKI